MMRIGIAMALFSVHVHRDSLDFDVVVDPEQNQYA